MGKIIFQLPNFGESEEKIAMTQLPGWHPADN